MLSIKKNYFRNDKKAKLAIKKQNCQLSAYSTNFDKLISINFDRPIGCVMNR